MKKAIVMVSLVMAVLVVSAQDKSNSWQVDKSHTKIGFTVQHLMISEVSGFFKDYDIEVMASKADFSDMKVKATIRVNSITTDNEKRDGHLMADEFFNAEKYPVISFNGYSTYKVDDKNFKITGDLTIRDVTKKVVFDAMYMGSVKSPWGQTVAVWKANTKINRTDYNLKWNAALETGGVVVGEEVSISLSLELTK